MLNPVVRDSIMRARSECQQITKVPLSSSVPRGLSIRGPSGLVDKRVERASKSEKPGSNKILLGPTHMKKLTWVTSAFILIGLGSPRLYAADSSDKDVAVYLTAKDGGQRLARTGDISFFDLG